MSAPSSGAKGVARAFPWGSLDTVRRADAAAWREVKRWCAGAARLEGAAAALGEIVGARITVTLRRAERGGRARPLDGGVGVLLARGDASERDGGALIEVEGALAAGLVARALKRPVARATSPTAPPSPNVAGALGAIFIAAARRAHAGSALAILGAGPSDALAQDLASGTSAASRQRGLASEAREFDTATLTVLVDDDAFLARVTLPRGALALPEPAWGASALAAMGDVELDLPLVACASLATAAEVGALAPGDAWMPGHWPLARARSDGPWCGPVLLAAAAVEHGVRADLGEDGRLVLRGGTEGLGWSPMSDSEKKDPLIESVGEVPVVVRVEIGAARMRAKEWANIGAGDVIALGRRVAEPVVLRVGGVEVALGELVEIEGEVGVRILSRTSRGAP